MFASFLGISTGDRVAIVSCVVAGLAAAVVIVQLIITHRYRRNDDAVRLDSKMLAYVVAGPDHKPYAHGMSVVITCTSKRQAEIIGVSLRLRGVDVMPIFKQGWSNALGHVDAPDAPLSGKGMDIKMWRNADGKLQHLDSEDGRLVLQRNQEARFFIPVPFPAIIWHTYMTAKAENLSIVVSLAPDEEIIVSRGEDLRSLLRSINAGWGQRPLDPALHWAFTVKTASPTLFDTSAMGTTNERPIQ